MDALILIDVQENMFDNENGVFEFKKKLRIINSILVPARETNKVIIFIKNNGGKDDPDYKGTFGWEIKKELTPKENEYIFEKEQMNAFSNSEFEKILKENNCNTLYFCGFQTNYCLEETEKNALELGYNAICISDAHSTYDEDEMTAKEIIEKFNKKNNRKLITSNELIELWKIS